MAIAKACPEFFFQHKRTDYFFFGWDIGRTENFSLGAESNKAYLSPLIVFCFWGITDKKGGDRIFYHERLIINYFWNLPPGPYAP